MTLVVGDCRVTLARWAAEGVRVQCVVTSPPYWSLRDYGTAPLVWGGEAGCAHAWGEEAAPRGTSNWDTFNGYRREGFNNRSGAGKTAHIDVTTKAAGHGNTCGHCGAWRGHLGLEPTPELYVSHLVAVFRLVRDVLAEDGTCWINLGDSFADKQLQGIPWRVAFALQADGWYLRSDIIWAKPNPMPESVTDRPTKAHEYIFLLSKRATYYYDAEAIKEPASWTRENNPEWRTQRAETNGQKHPTNRNAQSGGFTGWAPEQGRNRRSVWTIATAPYPDAHFATFPPDLVTPCILAGSRPGDVILDPFMGSGTVAMVAQDLGRAWIGCEMSEAYAALCERRTRQQGFVLDTGDAPA